MGSFCEIIPADEGVSLPPLILVCVRNLNVSRQLVVPLFPLCESLVARVPAEPLILLLVVFQIGPGTSLGSAFFGYLVERQRAEVAQELRRHLWNTCSFTD